MPTVFIAVIYLLFFLSGAAALVYQVVWVRSLTLVFGGSHLAVTAVLSIFMCGMALGGYAFGKRADRSPRPLRLYGRLELGIAASAVAFIGLTKVYPAMYIALAAGRDDWTLYLTVVRLFFSVIALIVPTMLMGGTLPVLSRFVARQPENLRGQLSFLYSFNTLGAVAGAILAGFVLLRLYSVTTTLSIAIATNAIIGIASIILQRTVNRLEAGEAIPAPAPDEAAAGDLAPVERRERVAMTVVLWGIGLSGFCALGYEVLWTRVLTVAVGASVYGFTIMLVAFLAGIALGSALYGASARTFATAPARTGTLVAWFGVIQVAIGVSALLVTVYLRDVPANAILLQNYFSSGSPSFSARVWASFALAFLYMIVPALLMGAAFPIAAETVARHRRAVGRAVGEVLAANTVGAIFGAAVSGLLMIQAFGIERSLQMLTALNVGCGLMALATLAGRRILPAAVAIATISVGVFLAVNESALRMWDRNYFAIFRSNQPDAFSTPEKIREAVQNTDVLYYAEGVESIVSVIKVRGGEQAFVTNGRVEASSYPQALQVQFTLGHLPMLLNLDPREVLVVGVGSGMTAGATAVHPHVERVTVAEIEPRVLGVARTFELYNHHVLDNPKVRIVVNDGRNFLLTTHTQFDVITADPIHPWFRGAGYLYSSEYFALAAKHLRPGGVIAQWLPIYELTTADLASVVKTFQQHFPHTLMWLMEYDAVLVGSNAPFRIDEPELERRIAVSPIADDLRAVTMGSAADFLSYFAMGTEGMGRFARNGTLNTDDRLYLEFSAPFSIATPAVMSANVRALAVDRENIIPYLKPAADPKAREEQTRRANEQYAAARNGDSTLARFLAGNPTDSEFVGMLRRLNLEYPWYAPGRFLAAEYTAALALEPRLLDRTDLHLADENGGTLIVEMSAVLVPVSRTRASIMFVDNRTQSVYGQVYLDDYDRDGRAVRTAKDIVGAIRFTYDNEATAASTGTRRLPPATPTLAKIRAVIDSKAQTRQSGL